MIDIIPLIKVENYDETFEFIKKYLPNKIILTNDTRPKEFIYIAEKIKKDFPLMKLGMNYPGLNDETIFFYIPFNLPDFIYLTNYNNINFKDFTGEYCCRIYENDFINLKTIKEKSNFISICPLNNNDTINLTSLYYLKKNKDIYCELFSLKHYKSLLYYYRFYIQ